MQRGSLIKSTAICLLIVVVSFLIVAVHYYFYLIPRSFEASGYPKEIPPHGIAYMYAVAFFYGPTSSFIGTAFDRLPYGGLLVSFASVFTATTIQNLLLWFGGKFVLERWRARKT